MRQRLLLIPLAIAFALLGAGVPYALSESGEPSAPESGEPSAPGTLPTVDRARQAPGASSVSALRRVQRDSDRLPASVADSSLLADGVADVTSARRLGVSADSGWIIPGRNGSMCHVREGFLNCPPASVIEERGLAPSVTSRDGVYRVDGIAADGISSASVTLWDKSVVKANVSNNTFSVKASQPVREVQWHGPQGPESMAFDWFFRLSAKEQAAIEAGGSGSVTTP